MKQMDLYKAVKWQVEEYQGEHGMSLVEMWKVVTYKNGSVENSTFWKQTCLEDYEYDHTPHSWWTPVECIVAKKVCKHFDEVKAQAVYSKYVEGGR